MRTLGIFLAVGILAVVAGCGGSSTSGGLDGGGSSTTGRTPSNGGQCPGSTGQSCTNESAYQSCLLNACGTEYKAALGNNFASGNFTGSPCADFMNCQLKCPCDATATTCEATCATTYAASGSTCFTALMAVEACVVGNTSCTCTPATNTNTNTNTNTSTGTGCTAAQACCASLGTTYGASVAQQCATALAGQTDAACTQLVASYKQAGVCP